MNAPVHEEKKRRRNGSAALCATDRMVFWEKRQEEEKEAGKSEQKKPMVQKEALNAPIRYGHGDVEEGKDEGTGNAYRAKGYSKEYSSTKRTHWK